MNLLKHINSTWNLIGENMIKFSARTSPCSDIPQEFWITSDVGNSREALAMLFLLDIITPSTQNYCLVENLRNHIAKLARNNHYSGDWNLVKEFLSNVKPFVHREGIEFCLQNMSESDYYGNFLRTVKRLLFKLKFRQMHTSVESDTRRYKKSQRKRGYDDKGSRRLPHEFHGQRPGREKSEPVWPLEPRKHCWFKIYTSKGSGT